MAHGSHHGQQGVLRHLLGVVRIATHLHAEREHLPLVAFEQIAERSAIPFARGQKKRVFRWGAVTFVCHVTSLACTVRASFFDLGSRESF